MRLILLHGVLAGPVKINAPEVWRRRQKLHPDANALRPALPGEHDPALQLFLRFRIHQHQHFIVINFMPQHQQAPVGVDYKGFAHLAKLLPRMAAPEGLQFHPVKNALAAAVRGKGGFLHSEPIISLAAGTVNCPFGQVFPIATLFRPATCKAQSAGRRMSMRLRHHAGRLLDQTAAALYFIIIFGQLLIRIERLSLRLGASYEPC